MAYGTAGLSTARQLVDSTSIGLARGSWDYTGTQETWVLIVPIIVPERITEYPADYPTRVVEIRRRSFARLGEAWRILADL